MKKGIKSALGIGMVSSCLVLGNVFSQTLRNINDSKNTVYRGFENKLVLDESKRNSKYAVTGTGCLVEERNQVFYVKPNPNSKSITLTISENGRNIASQSFDVRNLPAAQISLEGVPLRQTSRSTLCTSETGLSCTYPEESTFIGHELRINSYFFESKSGEKTRKTPGNVLSKEDKSWLSSRPSGETIFLYCVVESSEGVQRMMKVELMN